MRPKADSVLAEIGEKIQRWESLRPSARISAQEILAQISAMIALCEHEKGAVEKDNG
jgi:hypothetical protein